MSGETFRPRNTVPTPHGRGLVEQFGPGTNRVPPPSPILLVDRKSRTTYLVPRAYVEQVLEREAARKPRKEQYKKMRRGA